MSNFKKILISAILFFTFLNAQSYSEVVNKVEIKGNDIEGILSDGTVFNTYAPNDPNLVEKLTSKGVNITAMPVEDKMPSFLGILLSVGALISLFLPGPESRQLCVPCVAGKNPLLFQGTG